MDFRKNRKLKISAKLDMTPLIDVVLLLLLFFMLSSSFAVQNAINIEMPAGEGARTYDQRSISVSLLPAPGGFDGRGPVYVNSAQISSLEDLGSQLAKLQREHPDTVVLIRPDARVDTARLIEVLGVANSVGISRYQIAARPAPGTKPD